MDKEAKAMTAALNKEIKAQTAAIKKQAADMAATNGVKKLGEQAENAGVKFDKLGMAMGPISGVISKISPEAGSLASVVAGLTSGFQGLAAAGGGSIASLAPFAAILAPAALAVAVLTANMKYEAAQADASAASHKTLNEALQFTKQLADGSADAMLDLKVKVGQMAPEEAAYAKAVKAVTDESDAQIAKIEGWIASRKALGGAWGVEVKMLREAQEDTKKLTDERLLLILADAQWATHTRESAEFIAERDKAAAAAAARAAAAAAAEAGELAEREQALNDWVTASNTAYDQVFEHELAAKESRWALARERVAAVQAEFDADAKRIEDTAKLEEAAAEQSKAALKVNLSTTASVADSIFSVWDQLNQQKLDGIDTSTKDGRAAAMKQWEENKAASLAMATVQAALAIAMAVASAPPPLNIPAIVANTVAGGAAIASIAAAPPPAFHAGTSMVAPPLGGHPDEMSATLRRGEAVVSAVGVAAAGREMVGRWNSGRSAEAQQPLVMQYRHQVFNRFIRDNLRMSTPLSAAVSSGTASGFRNRG
jgi:hypothetical protein